MDGMTVLRAAPCVKPAYGGVLVNLIVDAERARELKVAARDFVPLDLSARELCDLELLATGAFSPLTGFMDRDDYRRVCEEMRLADGRVWPIPVCLGAPAALAERLTAGTRVALRDQEGAMVAVLTVSGIWEPERGLEAQGVYGSVAATHPEVALLRHAPRDVCLTGRLEVIELPPHHDFAALRATPRQWRARHEQHGVTRLLGYAPRGLLHRAHVETTTRLAQMHEARLLVLGAVGRVALDAPLHHPRVRAWQAAVANFPPGLAQLGLVELAARRCGPRAVLLNAVLARNFGCTHLAVEHDWADHGPQASGAPLYGSYSGQELMIAHEREIGIETVLFRDLIDEEDRPERFLFGAAAPGQRQPAGGVTARGREIARWFSYPSVLAEWQKPFRGRSAQGVTVFFTGLSGAGKSTIAQMLTARLLEIGERQVTLLDGDVVRKHLSVGLGFSREHRDLNVLRLGFVASLINQHRGVAICAPIAPYAQTRAQVRSMVEPHGAFVEVHVATPLAVCEARDRKGLYARARAGLIEAFTGISDPYEPPEAPDITIDTQSVGPCQAVEMIIDYLVARGLLSAASPAEARAPGGPRLLVRTAPRDQTRPRPAVGMGNLPELGRLDVLGNEAS